MNERFRVIKACLDATETRVGANGKGEGNNKLSKGCSDDTSDDGEEYHGKNHDEEGSDEVKASDVK